MRAGNDINEEVEVERAQVREAARFFQALGDETRLRLLAELTCGERTVGELVAILSCSQPNVSRHLKALKEVGLVRDRREGRNVSYGLSTPSRWSSAAREWIERLDAGLLPRELSVPFAPPEREAGLMLAAASKKEAGAQPGQARSELDPFLL